MVKLFNKIIGILGLGAFVFVYALVLSDYSGSPFHLGMSNTLILLVDTALIIVGACVIGKKVNESGSAKASKTASTNRQISKREMLVLATVAIILLIVELIVTYEAVFRTGWDVSAVGYATMGVVNHDEIWIEAMSEYVSIYPNNIFLVFIYSSIIRIWRILGVGISNNYLILAFINCVTFSVTGILTYLTARMYMSSTWSMVIYCIYALLTGLSPWILIPYSDSTGLIFPILIFYIYVRWKNTNKIHICAKWFTMTVLTYIAFQIKPQLSVVYIACLIISVRDWIGQKKIKSDNIKQILKAPLSAVIGMALALVISIVTVNSCVDSMGFTIDPEMELGWQHFLMQGVNPKSHGGNSDSDLAIAQAISSKAERDEWNIEEFKNRLNEMGVAGYMSHFWLKAKQVYLDGSFGWGGIGDAFYAEIYESHDSRICSVIRSFYYDNSEDNLYKYLATLRQIIWDGILIGIVLYCINVAFGKTSVNGTLLLCILGLMLYIQIFEAHARFLFTYSPLFILLGIMGVEDFATKLNLTQKDR